MNLKQLIDECINARDELKVNENSKVMIRLPSGKLLDINECSVYMRTNSINHFKKLILKVTDKS